MREVMDNTGGRINYVEGTVIRIIDGLGKPSKEVYRIVSSRSDRKGQALVECDGVQSKVHYKRIIPLDSDDKAICMESAGKNIATCPVCYHFLELNPNDQQFSCPTHGQKSILWIGVKPVISKQPKPEKIKQPVGREVLIKQSDGSYLASNKVIKRKGDQKGMKKAPLNLDDLAKLANCELYTLKNVEFDHARVEVNSHTLLFTGDNPRKLCFNTYNGNLGKKSADLPIADFIADKSENKRWYSVKDVSKAREQLEKNGYERR